MDNDKMEKLGRTIAKGKTHFILYYGVIFWGSLTCVLFIISKFILEGSQSLKSILLIITIFLLFGSIWGSIMWTYMNSKYSRYLKNQKAIFEEKDF